VSNINSYITIQDKGTILDLNVVNLQGLHSYTDDLTFNLYAPSGVSDRIWHRPCNIATTNFSINLDDEASSFSHPCPPNDGLTYKPNTPLTAFDNAQLKGKWRLNVSDLFVNDGGSLSSWGINVCMSNFCRLQVDNANQSGIGSLTEAISCAATGDTIKFTTAMNNTQFNLGNQALTINKNLTFLANSGSNISIISNSTAAPTITVNSGMSLKIQGLKIYGSLYNPTAGILNNGALTLNSTDVLNNPSQIPTALLKNNGAGTINLQGICNVKL
jgi:subtilisin-like proprotein convertase family protein